jgi:alkanesulfonate monooxygenase SsuD/methylene tetrahydromethanopterin reductase-like flavin-dependent oxidoreductase (luciferase family)
MGVDPRQRRGAFEESLALLRRLWSGEVVSVAGRFRLHEARISPLPPEPIEVWIGAVAPPAIDRAARLGDGWLAAPALGPEQARRQIELYFERCQVHGRRRGRAAIRRDVYVGENASEAEQTGGSVLKRGHRGFPSDAPIVGDVERVAEAFRELAAMGYEDVIVRNLVPDPERAVHCIERLAVVRDRI